MAAQHSKAGFFLRRNNVELDARFPIDAVDKILAIARAAAGLGGNRSCHVHIAPHQLIRTDRQRRERPVHRGIANCARRGQSFAQAHNAGKGIDHSKSGAFRPSNQQAAIIRAKV
jgi:hypothetical protein